MQKLRNDELGRISVEDFKNSEKLSLIIVLDNVRSAINVGSIFRTADAFRIMQICCCGITPIPPHRDLLKSALGATESVHWEYFTDTLSCINTLKEQNVVIAAIEQTKNSVQLQELKVSNAKPIALIFGHEMNGVSQDIIDCSDYSVEIPQTGTKHSLNIAVCAGIVLWEVFRKSKSIQQPDLLSGL